MNTMNAAGLVEAEFHYIEEPSRKPGVFLHDGRTEEHAERTPGDAVRTMPVVDARAVADTLSLDREGVCLVGHESSVRDFDDAEEVRSAYYLEVVRLVKAATGAARVLVFDHNVRSDDAQRHSPDVHPPVRFVHNDYTHDSGPQRVRDLVPDEAEDLLTRRFAVINVWKPISGPVQGTPLAVCSGDSIAAEDMVPLDLIYRDRTGEIYAFLHSPGHRWFYVPEMRVDEALLLKCYDSMQDGRTRFTAHSAFDDPTSPDGAAPRESIEARALAFFDA